MRALHRLAFLASLSGALTTPFVVTGCAGTPTRSSTGDQVDDTLITSKVKAALVGDRAVSGLDIAVETLKGTVQLSGFANSQAEVSRAVELASDVKGVRSVRNDLRLKAGN